MVESGEEMQKWFYPESNPGRSIGASPGCPPTACNLIYRRLSRPPARTVSACLPTPSLVLGCRRAPASQQASSASDPWRACVFTLANRQFSTAGRWSGGWGGGG